MKFLIFIFTFLQLVISAQTDHQQLVDDFKNITDMHFDMGRSPIHEDLKTFWSVVQKKQEIIPLLIEKMSDTTQTKADVPLFVGVWTVGDIAYLALQEIIKDIPTFELMGIKSDLYNCGYCTYWYYLREDANHRKTFQAELLNWYNKNKSNLVWVTSNDFLSFNCRGCNDKHPNGGHFELKK